MAAPADVIDPCTRKLKDVGLDNAQRANAFFIRGRGFHRAKRLSEAAEDYQAAVALDPNNEKVWVSWSNLDLSRGEMEGYVQKVARAARIKPDASHVLRAVGIVLWRANEDEKALDHLSRALAADPTDAFARLTRFYIYEARHKVAEAMADIDALVALPRDVINRDGYFDEQGDLRDFHVGAMVRRGEFLQEIGQDDRAAEAFDAAVADGRSVPALIARAEFLRTKALPGAIANLEEAVRKEPANALAQYELGVNLTIAKQFEPALAAFDKAIAARPRFANAYVMRARAHRRFGHTDQAVSDFIAALQTSPSTMRQSIMPALRHAGYWTSAQTPKGLTPDLEDAIRACMVDTDC